jgi:hypothetical protein
LAGEKNSKGKGGERARKNRRLEKNKNKREGNKK